MRLPPALLRLRIIAPAKPRISLWLPLFLLWPLLLLLLLPALVVAVLAIAFAPGRFGVIPEIANNLYSVVCATRGTHIDVCGAQAQILVSIY